ncbi:MAG: PqqD family protein [Bacillota bacterium]|nr:PqqD family protein [Bacillota bacterium]
MKIREGFKLRNVADEHMVIPTGKNISKYGGAVVLSDVAAFVFEQLKQHISREDLLTLILAEYDVDEATAASDLDILLVQLDELELLEQ